MISLTCMSNLLVVCIIWLTACVQRRPARAAPHGGRTSRASPTREGVSAMAATIYVYAQGEDWFEHDRSGSHVCWGSDAGAARSRSRYLRQALWPTAVR